jgi:hypothetical protein
MWILRRSAISSLVLSTCRPEKCFYTASAKSRPFYGLRKLLLTPVRRFLAAARQIVKGERPIRITDGDLQQLRAVTLVQFAKQCQAQGIDPAAHIYGRAQQLGYEPASHAPRKQPNTSLSNLQGSLRAPDERSHGVAFDIANLSEKEFDDLWKSMARDGIQRPRILTQGSKAARKLITTGTVEALLRSLQGNIERLR